MLQHIGVTGFLLIAVVALLLFGPNKLPELGRAFGKTLREFKKGANDMMEETSSTEKDEESSKSKVHSISGKTEEEPKEQSRLPE